MKKAAPTNEQLQNRREAIVEQLSTQTLPITEFENLCREQNEIMLLQESRRPKHYTKTEVIANAYSVPKTANLQR